MLPCGARGDVAVTRKMLAVLRRLEARAYGGAGLGVPRDGALWGRVASGWSTPRPAGPRAARAWTPEQGRRRAATVAHGHARCRGATRSGLVCVAGARFTTVFLKIFEQN
jgi:hypothetical protein